MAIALSITDTAASSGDAAQSHKHKRHKKDPFLELDDHPSPTDGASDGPNGAGSTSNSLLAHLILMPLSMVTLILSLFLVDRQERAWRLSQHASHPTSLWARLAPAEPYQTPLLQPDNSRGSYGDAPASDGSFTGWYRRKKHRAMAKLELDDALQMRGRVLVALLAWLLFAVLGFVYAVRRLYGWLSA